MTEYKTELRELSKFFPELANSEEYLCSKFKEGLSLKIREKKSITKTQSYKKVVFQKPRLLELEFEGDHRVLPICMISTLEAKKLLHKG